jgi:hypothetical protein
LVFKGTSSLRLALTAGLLERALSRVPPEVAEAVFVEDEERCSGLLVAQPGWVEMLDGFAEIVRAQVKVECAR